MKLKRCISIILVLTIICTFVLNQFNGLGQVEAAGKKSAPYLNKTSVTMFVKDKITLKLKKSKKSKKIKWSSKNKKIAKVNSKGVVTAKNKGSTYIIAKYDGKTYKCKVRVLKLAKTKFTVENKAKGITLSWNKVENAKGYYIYRSTNGKKYKRIAQVKRLTYVDKSTAKKSGIKYYYSVRAYRKNSVAEHSKKSLYRADTPTIKNISIQDYSNLLIEFTGVKGISSYLLEYVNGKSTTTVSLSKSSTNYTIPNVNTGDTFSFRIKSKSHSSFSDWSNVVKYTVLEKYQNYSLNENSYGPEDISWSWWTGPQAVNYNKIRNKTYFGYITNQGYIGIGAYDMNNGMVIKNNLAKTKPDDHNSCSVNVLHDGKIMAVYSGGHDSDKNIHVRISTTGESIAKFGSDTVLKASGKTSYAQVYKVNGTFYIFYRNGGDKWCYFSSSNLKNWSDECKFVSGIRLYYIKLTPTTDKNIMRVNLTSNPASSDCNIRQGFINFALGKVYNSDMTYLGNLGTSIDYRKFKVVIPNEKNKMTRLFDVAITDPSETEIAYCTWENTKTQADYKVLKDGEVYNIINGSDEFYSNYFGGISFISKNSIVVSYGIDKTDHVVVMKYKKKTEVDETGYASETYGFEEVKELDRNSYATSKYRAIRPIVDKNRKCILWLRGYYNINNYHYFNMDARFHEITSDMK